MRADVWPGQRGTLKAGPVVSEGFWVDRVPFRVPSRRQNWKRMVNGRQRTKKRSAA